MRVFINLLLAAVVAPAFGATKLLYENPGPVTNDYVNATHFLNRGSFYVTPITVPWNAWNTTTFSNRNLMSGNIGFRFETVPSEPFSFSRPAEVFHNSGTILAQDGGGSLPFLSGEFVGAFFAPDVSYVSINARAITNRGDISIGASGIIKLTGRTVDLTGGTLFVEDVDSGLSSGLGFGADVTETNFFPSAGIYDLAWGLGIDTNMNNFNLVLGTEPNVIRTPPFSITNYFGFGWCEGVSFVNTNAQVWVYVNNPSPTNLTVQVISVATSDTNIQTFASFVPIVLPRGAPQGGFLSPIVEFRVASTNFRTFELQTNSLNFFSQLGSQTNWNMTENLIESTLRPAPFVLFRSGWGLGEIGFPGERTITPDLFNSLAYSNRIATNQFASYVAEIDSMARRLPALPDLGVTNNPGRVEITTDDLRLRNTRIRGEGLVSLKATNVTSIQDSVIDVSRLNLNLATKSSTLRVPKLTGDTVERVGGYLVAHSAIWTNTLPHADTNLFVEVHFELLSIDATGLHTREPVTTHELHLRSTAESNGQIIFDGNFAVTNFMTINASSLTFGPESRLFLGKGVGFSYTNVVGLNNFTNFGRIQLNELADFRKSETERYATFVNHGDIIAYGHEIAADYFESTGNLVSSNNYTQVFDVGFGGVGGVGFNSCFGIPGFLPINEFTEGAISIRANQAKIDEGEFFTLGDIDFIGGTFKINNHSAVAGGRMFLNVTDSLSDNGIDTRNEWLVSNGFIMTGARPAGNLLGTEVTSTAQPFGFITHTWAGEDRGISAAGFSNNIALGKLSLRGERFSTFEFLPVTGNNAIYVDVLEISGVQAASLAEFRQRVLLDGVNIYYGDIQSTNAAFTAETLHQVFGPNAPNNLFWVSDFAGPRSGVDVPLTPTGPVGRFNRALRESINIDSDGDGIPNRFDPFPFPAELFELSAPVFNSAASTVTFSFKSQSATRYVIEYTTDLASGQWTKLKEILQSSAPEGMIPVSDSVKAESPQRFYRVRQIE